MERFLDLRKVLVVLAFAGFNSNAQVRNGESIEGAGITPYVGYKAYNEEAPGLLKSPYVKNIFVIFQWSDLEPENGSFVFEQTVGRVISEVGQNGKGVALMVWAGPSSPNWIYSSGVPLVQVKDANNDWHYPYYFSDAYQKYFFRLLENLGSYLKSIPEDAIKKVQFLAVTEGSTGDTGPFQGRAVPVDEKYRIAQKDWMDFRMKVWERYRKALWKDGKTIIPLLFTDDANTERERGWQLANLSEFGVKKGQFGHGYNNNNILRLIDPWTSLKESAKRKKVLIFARGEWDNILLNQGWVKRNPGLAFYWSALSALYFDLDYWNPAPSVIRKQESFSDGLKVYNKYASSLGDPVKATYAFCAMHRMLDIMDVKTFPERIYGKAQRTNVQRYLNIIKEFTSHGASIGDTARLSASTMDSRRRNADNDIGWNVYGGNFFKHLEQVAPEETSDAYWNLDTTIYGRFARAFKMKPGNELFFSLNKNFFRSNESQRVLVSVISKDSGTGSWELLYFNGKEKVSAGKIRNGGSNKWVEHSFTIPDGVFNNGLNRKSDLILRYNGGDNTFFHLIELKKIL